MKRSRRALTGIFAAWIGFAVFVALAGSSVPAECATDNASSFDDVDIIDASLNGKLAIQRVGSEATPTGLLSVFVGLKNKTARDLNVQLETIYKDQEGNPVNAGSWITLSLKPHEEREYRSTSISVRYDPNLMDANFVIRIRHAAPTVPPIPPMVH
jgi:hypothetical protein